ncbi:hypothetical protein OHS70_37580 [Streptomyces sp. NBC_00390]|uniref:hypothetical protein n=1 Tax=Streptomyces sp. NBC_00390 TaxID=2975736 RepID=UPI002E1B15A6
MDAGVAAILGSTVGVAGTTVAAVVAAWSTRWQVRSQAHFDHHRWRREVRQAAYSTLISEAVAAEEGFQKAWSALGDGGHAPNLDEAMEQVRVAENLVRAARRAASTVAVEGPAAVVEAADTLMTALGAALSDLYFWHADRLREIETDTWKDRHATHVLAARARLKEFSGAAREALDDETHLSVN